MGLHPGDFGVLASGALAVVSSAGASYTVTVERASSFTAWHGFLGWFGVVLVVAGAGVVAAGLLGILEPAPARVVAMVLCLAAATCTVASYAVTPGQLCSDLVHLDTGCEGAVVGRGGGFWRTLVATGGGAFVALYWHVVDRRGRPPEDDSSHGHGRW